MRLFQYSITLQNTPTSENGVGSCPLQKSFCRLDWMNPSITAPLSRLSDQEALSASVVCYSSFWGCFDLFAPWECFSANDS